MKQQGRCVLPADETGRVLDRLTALEKVISPMDIQQVLDETGLLSTNRNVPCFTPIEMSHSCGGVHYT